MTLPRALLAVLTTTALGAPAAPAGVRLVARDQPVGVGLETREVPTRFNMVGLHWQGGGRVDFRTRSLAGIWSAWRPARPEAEDLPERGTAEARATRGWKLGNPYWTGAARAIQYRIRGAATHVRAFFIWSPVGREPPRTYRAARPGIVSRAQWGADESIVRAPPYYADRVRFAVVHHTAGTNSYSAAQSAAIVRGIQRYHVLANGWNDIGYNFLVDKHGQVFEGRGGGIARNVVGAHAQGFNTGSTGVAVLGTYSSARVSRAARSALVRLLTWRLDVAHVEPLARLTWISGGNPKYPDGTAVSLRAVSGHRDTGPTTCPGSALHAQLAGIASAISRRGLPKLYDPEVSGELGRPVVITGRLSTALPWTVTIRDEDGAVVAGGGGTGSAVDWTWDASEIPFGTFTYTIEAGPQVRPWTAKVPGPPPLHVQGQSISPRVIARTKSGAVRPVRISFRLTTAANVTVDVFDPTGARVRRLLVDANRPGGTTSLSWNGRKGNGALVPSGRYRVRVSASATDQSASSQRRVVADWTLSYLRLGARPISPNGDGRRDDIGVTFALAEPASTRLRVLDRTAGVATLVSSDLPAGTQSHRWNGRDRHGNPVPDGVYAVRVEATTALGTRYLSRRVRVDSTAPSVRIISAVARRRTRVVVQVSEPARLVVRFGSEGEPAAVDVPAGRSAVSRRGVVGRVRVVAWDAAENRSAAAVARVRRR